MANLKLNNVIVVAEASGTATLQNSIIKVKADGIKASDGTAGITIATTTGAVTTAGAFTSTGAATLSSTLGVTGAATLASTLGVTGAATLSSTLGVTGAATLSSTLAVSGNVTAGGNLTVTGDLTVNGTNTTINATNLQVDDKQIELAHSPSGSEGNDAAVDGGGIILKSSDSDKTISWVNATDAWTFNQHLFPSADATQNLGSATKRWNNIYTTDLHLANERGNWTVIEEENYLTLRNNKTDKVYKLVMEEIE